MAMEELKTTSFIISSQMSTLITFIQSMDTTMDTRLFSYTTIVSKCIAALNSLQAEGPRSINDILTDIISIALPLANISDIYYKDAQSLISAIIFKHKGRDAISQSAFNRLEQNAVLLTNLRNSNRSLIKGAIYNIKEHAYIILGPLALGTDYWIYDQDYLDRRKSMISVPSLRISDLMPLKSSDFALKGHIQLLTT